MRALVWIARYVEQARDKLLLDEKERTLFVTNQGEPLNPDSLTEYARRYIQSAGINKPGACHIFRHTMATLMHDNGADLTAIQIILGHEKSDTTQIYARTSLRVCWRSTATRIRPNARKRTTGGRQRKS